MGQARLLLCALFLGTVGLAVPARAAQVTVQISGTWDSVADTCTPTPCPGVLDGSVTVGGSFVATLVYDDATVDADPDPSMGAFDVPAAISDLSLTTGNYAFSPASGLGIAIDDDNPFGEDVVFLFAESYSTSGPLPSGVSTGGTSFANPTLTDTSGAAHSSDSLTGLPWSIGAYDLSKFYFFTGVRGAGSGQYIELSGTITGLAVLPPPNMVPVASAGADLSAPEGSLVTLEGSGSSDPEGQMLAYQWTQTSGPPVTLDLTDPVHPTFTAPAVPPNGGLVAFDLTVTDPPGSTDTDSVEITITNVNAPPEANAGPDQVAAEGASVVLDGSGSLDQDGDTLSFAWLQTGGPTVTLSGENTAQLSFMSPQVGVAGALLRFEVTVSDGVAATADSVEVFVTNLNLAPAADAGPDQAVNEGAPVTLDGSGSSDPDDDALSYEWSQVGGPGVVLSSTTSQGPTFTAPTVPASGFTLSFQVVVSDGALSSDPDFVDVRVKNVNHPPVADAGDDQTVAEASPVALDASASYDVDLETLSFSWVQVAGSGVTLSGAGTATPSFAAPPVGALGETLTFEVTVGDGIDTASDRMDVVVENVNHAPVADASSDQIVNEGSSVALDGSGSEDPDADSLAYQWEQLDGPAVALSSYTSPSPTFIAPLVGAGGAQLEFGLVVNDGLAASEPDQVLVTVQNVNDPPLCDSAEPSVAVLWPPNHKLFEVAITGVSDPNLGDLALTVTGVTQDEPVKGLGDGDSSPDAVISGSGVMVRSERSGLHDGRVYRVQFTASDGAGSCTGSVAVCVSHDRKGSCTDSGQAYDSTAP